MNPSRLNLANLAMMFAMLAASVWVFAELVGRQTRHRRRVSLSQWARGRKMRVVDPSSVTPETALPELAALDPKIISLIRGESAALAQVQTNDSKSASPAPSGGRSNWNLLQTALPADWQPCGLRPASGAKSLIDLFGLSSFPSLAIDRRFMVFAGESRSAAQMVASGVLSRLPSDIGLLLVHRQLILDFSTRHFDEVEFTRMLELAVEITGLLVAIQM
jgi:hypothetical protein